MAYICFALATISQYMLWNSGSPRLQRREVTQRHLQVSRLGILGRLAAIL